MVLASSDQNKFPAISGEVSGQNPPAIKSVLVNDKPVKVQANGAFKMDVKLPAGEKYLVIKQLDDRIQITKKYLIMRRSPTKQFKILVIKEEDEMETLPLPRIKTAPKVAAPLTSSEKEWIENTPAPRFFAHEFTSAASIESLGRAVFVDLYPFIAKKYFNPLHWLNDTLTVPDLYEKLLEQEKHLTLREGLKILIKETAAYRKLSFSRLNAFQQKKLLLLNRLLLEAVYPETPVRKNWQVSEKEKAAAAVTQREYLYIWEAMESKLLAAKESKGVYSAEILVPVSEKWLSHRGLSARELSDLIQKPVKTIKADQKTTDQPAEDKK
jgi:hypothetical protein